jgi:uncharacterized protein (DUF39 family)
MNAIKELLSNIGWMIRDLVDGDQIDNDEEKRLNDVYEKSRAELAATQEVIEAARVVDWGAIATVLDEIILDEGDETIVSDIRNLAARLQELDALKVTK